MYHMFITHSSIDGHLGCFHVLNMETVSYCEYAAMNIGVQGSF